MQLEQMVNGHLFVQLLLLKPRHLRHDGVFQQLSVSVTPQLQLQPNMNASGLQSMMPPDHHVDEALQEWVVVQAEANRDYVARLQQLLVSYDEDHSQVCPQLLLQTFELTETKETMISLIVDVQQGQLDL